MQEVKYFVMQKRTIQAGVKDAEIRAEAEQAHDPHNDRDAAHGNNCAKKCQCADAAHVFKEPARPADAFGEGACSSGLAAGNCA